jgi:glycerophosphoryl diester phosphodiesterase
MTSPPPTLNMTIMLTRRVPASPAADHGRDRRRVGQAVAVSRLPSLRPPIGFAHRGARAHAPENTLEAFRLALRLGAGGLESDVWITADGHAVLDHDGIVGRRPRRRPIAEVDRDDLPTHIPTLRDFYEVVGPETEISLDVKDPDAIGEVIACARDAEAEARLWLCHPDRELLASWRSLSAEVHLVESTRLARFQGGPELHVARSASLGIEVINLHHSDWTGGLIAMVHRFELLAFGWDAQSERVLDELLDAGIDGVFSDHVDRMAPAIVRAARTS